MEHCKCVYLAGSQALEPSSLVQIQVGVGDVASVLAPEHHAREGRVVAHVGEALEPEALDEARIVRRVVAGRVQGLQQQILVPEVSGFDLDF